ncbi:MAG TPA: HAMP domain-containing sensor histidine kinase, partial [Flavisolibacter sp.]
PVRMLRTDFYHNNKYYQMQVITSMVEEDDLISELLYAIIWLYAGLIAAILVLNNFLLKKIWQPFYHLLKQLKNFKLEKPVIEVKQTRVDEFRMLNDAVRKMIQSNVDSFNSQKHFIENASHELQTPLAISISKLESLASMRQLSENEARLLTSALDNLQKLTRLNRSLLLLSKIENNQFVEIKEVSINELVKKVVEDFSDQLDFQEIEVSIVEEGQCEVKMNEDLSGIFITNLVKNAVVHNKEGGTIEIKITGHSLVISNSGISKAQDENKIFSRFNKSIESGNSTGLGLSIVKAIAGLFQFHVSYSYTGKHTITVVFTP